MNGRNDEREIEDDGFYTVSFDERAYDASKEGIVTTYIHPPIPIRIYDWQATMADYEPGYAIGHGETEQEAIADLLDQLSN